MQKNIAKFFSKVTGTLKLALELGIKATDIIFNGNGKTVGELEQAIRYGVTLNVDSNFDFDNIKSAVKKVNLRTFSFIF